MTRRNMSSEWLLLGIVQACLAAMILTGCAGTSGTTTPSASGQEHEQFVLEHIDAGRARDLLAELEVDTASAAGGRGDLSIGGATDELERAAAVLEFVDSETEYVVEKLALIAQSRNIPSNPHIARLLGDVEVGTFAAPPQSGAVPGIIVDVCGDYLVAVVPAALRAKLAAIVAGAGRELDALNGDEYVVSAVMAAEPVMTDEAGSVGLRAVDSLSVRVAAEETSGYSTSPRGIPILVPDEPLTPRQVPLQFSADGQAAAEYVQEAVIEENISDAEIISAVPTTRDVQGAALALSNADEVLQLDLPSQLDLIQLLDLVGEYVTLDYMYDPAALKGQVVTLKMHGKLRGEMTVGDLYALLESVLKFKGFAMTRRQGNLVTIVPVAEAMGTNPDLIDGVGSPVDPGDMVVTSVFDLQSIDVSSASTLLQNMKLSLALTPVEASRTLIVTCYAHQVERIEQLLAMVDHPGRPKEFRFRQLNYTMAGPLTSKVKQLTGQLRDVSVIAETSSATPDRSDRPRPMVAAMTRTIRAGGGAGSDDSVFLDADERTNRILMIGYREELAVVEELINALDVAQQDLRVGKIYGIRYVDAEEIGRKLRELGLLGGAGSSAAKISTAEIVEGAVTEAAQVVVLEATNSLVITATEEQHRSIEAMLVYLDVEVRRETIPYEIYFLENQDPDNLAAVLEKIIHETVENPEAKLQQAVHDADDRIMIVPDQQTFSLIVYANRKNQEWISKLVSTLDRRRPQVLIDVTLVEIRKADEFSYDLDLVTSLPDLIQTGGQTGSFLAGDQTVIEKLLEPGAPSQFADLQISSGEATGFYADIHVNALLKAMQQKNYGRVLAKPKVLVNDNETGTIKTTDTTYVIKRTSIPVTDGSAGSQNTLIETAIDYAPYDAGITLEITPHISSGRLLRLDINLSRSDFTLVTGEKPPDQTSSDINTVVTVPDGSTIILGGMLRLNQSKGGGKVPILGDIPLLGIPFRSVANSDTQSKLYVFVKAEVIRPSQNSEIGKSDLERISEYNRAAFEAFEAEFQTYQNWPGVRPQPVEPSRALDAQ